MLKRTFQTRLKIVTVLLCVGTVFVYAQKPAAPDSGSGYVNILKSAVIPGWGQLNQERLSEAALFYFGSATFYYRTLFHFYWYKKSGSLTNRSYFTTNLSVALFLHTLNIIDAADTELRKKPSGWQGALFSDKPLKSPWGAALRSAMLPGWGQVYTESYWKAAGYCAVNGFLLYKAHLADRAYRDTGEVLYRERRSTYSWYFGLAYLLSMADAYAGAYLYKFDEAMRLTVLPEMNQNTVTLGLHVRF